MTDRMHLFKLHRAPCARGLASFAALLGACSLAQGQPVAPSQVTPSTVPVRVIAIPFGLTRKTWPLALIVPAMFGPGVLGLAIGG